MSAPYHHKALPEGTILREWRLEQVLGVGGFGIVYRGRGVYFDELVAIKEYFPSAISDRLDDATVKPTDSSAEEIYDLGLKKFVEEAKILWNLSKPERHPNIVSVRSLFEIHGTAYMVMDFESGVSLSQMLREGKTFDEQSLMALVRPVAEGLDRAHRAGVVHRDIKPANLLVAEDGRPVLIDFGSARFDSGQATSTKVTFYTPPYAALEQYVKTYPQGAWTDIYALGVMMYQCVTGEKPAEVLERLHGGADEALSAREWPGYSRAFTRAIDAAMAPRPADRPQSIPDWLKLFDEPAPDPEPAAFDDEATRIVVAPPRPAAAAPVAPVAEAAAVEPAPAPEPAPASVPAESTVTATLAADPEAPPPARGRPVWLIAAGGAAAVVAVGAAFVLLKPGAHGPAPTAASGAPAAASAAAAAASPGQRLDLGPAADGLVADAQHAGRPGGEIGALQAFDAKAKAMSAEVATSPPGPAQVAAVAALNAAAIEAARREAASLARAAQGQVRDADRTLGRGGSAEAASAMETLHRTKAGLDQALAGVTGAADGASAITALRAAFAPAGMVSAAYADASRYFAPAKQAQVAQAVAASQAVAGQVVARGGGAKPWLFASAARKAAYKTLQDNATRARAAQAQLSQLGASAAATSDLKRLDADVVQAEATRQMLEGLNASSAQAAAAN